MRNDCPSLALVSAFASVCSSASVLPMERMGMEGRRNRGEGEEEGETEETEET